VNCYFYDILSPKLDDNFLTGHILTAILRFVVNSDACLCSHNFCILSAVALSYVQIVKCLWVGVFCLKCNFFVWFYWICAIYWNFIKILVILTLCFRPEHKLNSKIALESVYVADNNNQRSDQQCGVLMFSSGPMWYIPYFYGMIILCWKCRKTPTN